MAIGGSDGLNPIRTTVIFDRNLPERIALLNDINLSILGGAPAGLCFANFKSLERVFFGLARHFFNESRLPRFSILFILNQYLPVPVTAKAR